VKEALQQARRFRRGEEPVAQRLEEIVQLGLQWRTQPVDELKQPDHDQQKERQPRPAV